MVRLSTQTRLAWSSDVRFRELIENVSDVIYWTDVFGRFTFVNPAAARMMKCRERDLLGRSFLDRIQPAHCAAVSAFYARQLRERRVQSYFEVPARTSAGELLWLGQNVRTLFDDRGTVVGFEAVARDITAQKALEAERERVIAELQMALAGVATPASLVARRRAS
jgi:PAS domain S-box-containing protein